MNGLISCKSRLVNFALSQATLAIGMLAVSFASVGPLRAASPWESLVPFKKIDADPNNAYPIMQSSGPWMILAYTFRGDKASQQAQQLAYELRSKDKLPAYTYE